jgi:hypothetical protein
MAVWNSVFLHEFLDGNPANFRALPGNLTVLPDGPVVQPTPDPADRGFRVSPGRVLGYQFQGALANVIGVDLSVDLVLAADAAFQDLTVLSLGGGAVTLMMPGVDVIENRAGFRFTVGGQGMDFALRYVPLQPIRVRVRWHTHGQAQVWQERLLRAYQPGFAAGHAVGIDGLTVGGPIGRVGREGGYMLVRRVYVKLLRCDDARNELGEQVPIDTSMLPRTSCATGANALLADMQARTRKFMSEFIAKTTTSWREGQPQAPFTPEAMAAHQAAVAAGEAFVAFLAGREESAARGFLEQLGTFVDTVAAADPPRYAALLKELAALVGKTDPNCRDELRPLYEANAHTLEPLARLLQEAGERVRAASEGGSHA